MFAVLSIALLPLGLIAFFASLQTTRDADVQRRELISVALDQSARRLGAELGTDITALGMAVAEGERIDQPLCDRTASLLSARRPERVEFAIRTADGRGLCRSPGFIPQPMETAGPREVTATIDTARRELRVRVWSDDGGTLGIAVYPEALLGVLGEPSSQLPPHDLWLREGGETLVLHDALARSPLTRAISLGVRVEPIGLLLEMSVASAPFTAPEILAMLLPILMWLAAAIIGWLVVDRLLLAPLKEFRTAVSGYRPGDVMEPARRMTIPAQELRDLSATFRSITEKIAGHEHELAEGLSRQRRLTREVHHRVKNNLQVVASLINLHARSARSPEAESAYATIQRRVDALAVVHRNHYAELEENRGVSLRSLIGEIASNLRGTAPAEAARMGITLDICPCQVALDTAVPVAFLITELVELAMVCDPSAQVAIRAVKLDQPDCVELSVTSAALAGASIEEKLGERFGRVLEGLARQLRTQVNRDAEAGRFSINVPLIE